MEKILIDANFIVSLLCSEDFCHTKAVAISDQLSQKRIKAVLNNPIFYEILTVLSMRGVKPLACLFYRTVTEGRVIDIVYLTSEIEEKSFAYFESMRSKNITFFDCTLFATADAYGIKRIISFDKHLRNRTEHAIIYDPNQLP